MYIKKLSITNFRAFKYLALSFNKGVNILIGENNSGKSAIIDALRICLGYGKSEYMLSVLETDLHINPSDPDEKNSFIQFDLIFEIENNPIEKQCFYDFISIDKLSKEETIQLHLKFTWIDKGKQKYFKRDIWGGDNEHQHIPFEALQEIFFTYLDPLRNAVYALKPYSYNNKTAVLFNELTKYKKDDEDKPLTEEKKKELAKELYSVFESDDKDWKHILKTGNSKVNDHLEGTGITNKYPDIKMNYVGRKYSDIVKGIELKRPIFKKVAENDQQYFELYQNGLGENNLIYTSVVLGDLINRCEDKELQIYNALLVEEPEAHLHPQYQNTFFKYLDTLQNKGLQIFITSHSPTITAKSSIKNLIVLQRQNEIIAPFVFSVLTDEDFSEKNKRHLRKFLDTTKSQMFFSNGVLLVEGIAEAILLPVLAKNYLNNSIDLEKEGIEIVNISGVAFEHFAKLFNNDTEEKRLLSRCAIITDSDPTEGKPKSDRAIKAEGMKKNNLFVSLAPNTLEHDLFEESESNKKVIRRIYRSMHPDTNDLKGDFSAIILMEKLKSNKDKGDFALELRDALDGNIKDDEDISELLKKFKVPEYLEDAINWVTHKEKNV